MRQSITPFCSRYGGKGAFKGKKVKRTLTPHALKGQKLLDQGNTLGIISISKSPCKGKSFLNTIKIKDYGKEKSRNPEGVMARPERSAMDESSVRCDDRGGGVNSSVKSR